MFVGRIYERSWNIEPLTVVDNYDCRILAQYVGSCKASVIIHV